MSDFYIMKTAIIGSRSIKAFDFTTIEGISDITAVVSGGAVGVDTLAREYFGGILGLPFEEIKPDYNKHGRAAPHIRNRMIVDSCDMVLAVWDGTEKGGTYSTIKYARSKGKKIKVIQCQI